VAAGDCSYAVSRKRTTVCLSNYVFPSCTTPTTLTSESRRRARILSYYFIAGTKDDSDDEFSPDRLPQNCNKLGTKIFPLQRATASNATTFGNGRVSQTLHPRGRVGGTQVDDGVKVETTDLRPRQRLAQRVGSIRVSKIPLVYHRTDCVAW